MVKNFPKKAHKHGLTPVWHEMLTLCRLSRRVKRALGRCDTTRVLLTYGLLGSRQHLTNAIYS